MSDDMRGIVRVTKIDPTPKELAEAFVDLDNEQMAHFFNHLAERIKMWPSGWGSFDYQMAMVAESKSLTPSGLTVFRIMASYGVPE